MTKLELAQEKKSTATEMKELMYNEYLEWQLIERIFEGEIQEILKED